MREGGREEEKTHTQTNTHVHTCTLTNPFEHGQTPSDQPLKETDVPSCPSLDAISCEELHISIFIPIIKDSSIASCQDFLFGVGDTEAPMSLILKYKSSVIDTTAEESALLVAPGSTDGSWTATWFSRGSTDHGCLLRRLNPENPFFISDILLFRVRVITWFSSTSRGRTC